MPRRHPNYDRKLSRAFVLVDRRRLVTLRAAVNVISELPGPSPLPPDIVDDANAALLRAAEGGKRADIEAATDAVERVLRDRLLLAGE